MNGYDARILDARCPEGRGCEVLVEFMEFFNKFGVKIYDPMWVRAQDIRRIKEISG